MKTLCNDLIRIKQGEVIIECRCEREVGHAFRGFDKRAPFEFHRGGRMVWDDRCAWRKGEEPR